MNEQTEEEYRNLKDMIHQESLKLNDIQSTNSNDQLIIIGLQKQIADLE